MMENIVGQRVLITSGSRGLGLAVVETLLGGLREDKLRYATRLLYPEVLARISNMPSTLPQAHATFLKRLRKAVASDDRFLALLIGGSYIHGGLDEHSDLDFVIVVKDESYADVMASRMAFANALTDLISAFTGEHGGEPRLLICLYGPPLLHIDLKFVLASELDRQIERRAVLFAREPEEMEKCIQSSDVAWPNPLSDWFEARSWIWLHYAATKLARGELYEAIGMLGFFREQGLGPLLHRRAGQNQRGVRRLEFLRLDEHGSLATTVARHHAASVRDAIEASISIYLDLRADDPSLQVTRMMPELLRDFIELAVPKPRRPSMMPSGGTMRQRLSLTALFVRDYDEAIAFYVGKLGFDLREDTELTHEKRWVVVGPKGGDASLLLAKAVGAQQTAAVGQQGGGRVFLFLESDNFARDYARYVAAGVAFRDEPRTEPYGKVAVFEDLYDNPWDLIKTCSSDCS